MGIRGIKVKLVISASAVIIFLVAVIIAIRPVPASVQITFLGFTNDPPIPHVSFASFCVSNTGNCSMYGYGFYHFERKGWPSNPLRTEIEFPAPISDLKPGEAKMISFRKLPQTGPWRLELALAKIDWRYRLQQKRLRFIQKLPWQIQSRLVPRHEEYYSDWIMTPESKSNSIGTAKSTPP